MFWADILGHRRLLRLPPEPSICRGVERLIFQRSRLSVAMGNAGEEVRRQAT